MLPNGISAPPLNNFAVADLGEGGLSSWGSVEPPFGLNLVLRYHLTKLKLKDFPRYSFHTSAYMKAI